MVCIRNLTGLLLALAAVPTVLSTPVVAGDNGLVARAKGDSVPGDINSLLGGGDSSSGDGSAPSSTPSAITSTVPLTTSVAPTSTAGPTSTPPQTTSSPQQTTSVPATTAAPKTSSIDILTTTVIPSSGGTQVVIEYRTTTTAPNGAVETAVASQTLAATADSSSGSGGSSNSGTPTKTIVGAVVGGVGGLILIALAGVAWRIWGKNRHSRDEDDALMDDGVYGSSEYKTAATGASGTSPFQNNLEQYHNGKTNPSANF